jgi:uncharacterized protein HemY
MRSHKTNKGIQGTGRIYRVCRLFHLSAALLSLISCLALAEPAKPLRLALTPPPTNSDLTQGFQHLQNREFVAASLAYQKALRGEPDNTDALLALAALAEHHGRNAEAQHYRQRAWRADPLDANVQAAIFGRQPLAAVDAESRLKIALDQHPDSAALYFALGNLYARQKRWPEAQQAYFSAVSADIDNPDYLFNLAVSLDQLNQPRLAAQHYQRALSAGQQRPAAFTTAQIEKRLQELTP